MHVCPLCHSQDTCFYHQDHLREYANCQQCKLVFVPPTYFLSSAEEKAHYDNHQNNPADLGYRKFLSRLFDPLNHLLPPNSSGFDFGSGPGPTLSIMFEETGHSVEIHDPYYAPNKQAFNQTYDFITATEVLEHLHNPKAELEQLWACLRPGGWLGIMTKRVLNQESFKSWHYKNDPTHVCFFDEETFHFLADQWQADLTFHGADVVIFKRI